MRIDIHDIIFFLVLGFAFFILLWLLHGSPTMTSAIIATGSLLVTSEMFLWKKVFSVDKHTAVSFERLKGDVKTIHYKLDNLEKLIKNKA